MATKYSALDIDTGLIPKRWLDSPLLTFDQAEAIQNKLDNDELNIKLNEGKVLDSERKQSAQKKLEKTLEERKARGEPDEMTPDELFAKAAEYDINSGNISSAANREVTRQSRELTDKLNQKKLDISNHIYRTIPGGGVVSIDPTTNEVSVLREPKPSEPKGDQGPFTVYDPDTGEKSIVKSKSELAIKKAAGFKQVSDKITEKQISDMEFDKEHGLSSGMHGLSNPKPAIQESSQLPESTPEEIEMAKKMAEKMGPVSDVVIKPGERVVQDKKGQRFILHADGSKTKTR